MKYIALYHSPNDFDCNNINELSYVLGICDSYEAAYGKIMADFFEQEISIKKRYLETNKEMDELSEKVVAGKFLLETNYDVECNHWEDIILTHLDGGGIRIGRPNYYRIYFFNDEVRLPSQ